MRVVGAAGSAWQLPGLELELLDPGDEDELMLLLEARHAELADAPDIRDEVIVDGASFNPRLHLAMH